MNRLYSIASFGAVIAGGLVGVAVTRLPEVNQVDRSAARLVQPAPVGRSLADQSPQSDQITARQVGPNGPTWAEIPMEQFSKVTDPMPSIILPPPSNPGPRTRAPWWNYHYVTHTDGKTWHVEPTLDINGNPIPIYWPE